MKDHLIQFHLYISFDLLRHRFISAQKDSIKYLEAAPSPRIIKTHVPYSMLPPNALEVSKVILVARNPKDVCVSYYNQEQIIPALGLPKGSSFDKYVDYFISGKPSCYGGYWEYNKVKFLD